MSAAEVLLHALREHAGKRRRLALDDVWHVFRATLAIEYSDRGREALAAYLVDLQGQGHLQLPRQHSLWDRTPEPPLPRWVQLATPARAGPPIDHRAVAWPPELARLVDEPRIAPDVLQDLLKIKRFLAEGGRRREPVPLRERSVELLGDEKRLDVLLRSRLFRSIGLGPEILRAREVPVPIVWEPGPDDTDATSILVLENLHTYDSFRRWNAREGAHLAVVYGGGKAFAGMLDDLGRIVVDLGAFAIHYFGDLDAEGLYIAAAAARALGELPLVAAERWYDLLLARGAGLELPDIEPSTPEFALLWLPERLRDPVRQLLAAGRRLPQELVGWEQLRTSTR
ncbi:MAG: hypothetical protein JNL82_04425 [Myxococcales bacterium]|nr:hypothetical protein [Myxococcales bacterium]